MTKTPGPHHPCGQSRESYVPIRVFPHAAVKATWLRGSTINRVIGATLAQWGFPRRIAKLKESLTGG